METQYLSGYFALFTFAVLNLTLKTTRFDLRSLEWVTNNKNYEF